MDDSITSESFLERPQPLSQYMATPGLNDQLQTQHIDVSEDDVSFQASTTRFIANALGALLTPRQMIAILRVLKAVTFCFLMLTVLSDVMYMCFLEIMAAGQVRQVSGGARDTVIRLYGLLLAFIALGLETNHSFVLRRFSGLKGFIPRSVFIFFIAVITGSHPIYDKSETSESQRHQYGNEQIDDAKYDDDDDDASLADSSSEIPASSVGFQMVTSVVLGICALGYLVCGLLCFDRFTTRAFLSPKDPRITTAIPASRSPSHDTCTTGRLS